MLLLTVAFSLLDAHGMSQETKAPTAAPTHAPVDNDTTVGTHSPGTASSGSPGSNSSNVLMMTDQELDDAVDEMIPDGSVWDGLN